MGRAQGGRGAGGAAPPPLPFATRSDCCKGLFAPFIEKKPLHLTAGDP